MNLQTIHNKIFVHFRRRRMKKFFALIAPTPSTRMIDIGGAPITWTREAGVETTFPITLCNIRFPRDLASQGARFSAVEADATELPFPDKSFDVAFSNSVIEHLGTWERQQAFAREARRVGDKLWIQTPARSFPIEPHYLAPFIHFLPKNWQRRLARRATLWGLLTKPSPQVIDEWIDELRLLSYSEFKQLFPDCHILKERLLGFTKSYVAVRTQARPQPKI